MIGEIFRFIKKIDEPDRFEITWAYVFKKIIFLICAVLFFYYLEHISEFFSAIFGDGNKYLPVNERRREFRMIIVLIICFIGLIPTSYVFYKLVFRQSKK